MERILALALLFMLSPILIFLFVLVKLTSKGPFIFRQERVGKNRKRFTIYKIRSMILDSEKNKQELMHLNEASGPVFKIYNDPRYTRIGKILAHTGFDEIVQLINIVKGEMSFVGPRPLPLAEAAKIPKKYSKRFSIKPGITSLWVIRGAHNMSFREWMESDIEYFKKKNPLTDFYIFIVTILLAIKWNVDIFFTLLFTVILIFYALFPYSIWLVQIYTFIAFLLLFGLHLKRKVPYLFILFTFLFLCSAFLSANRIDSIPIGIGLLSIFLLSTALYEEKKRTIIKSFIAASLVIGFLSMFYSIGKIIADNTLGFLGIFDANYNLVVPQFGHAFYGIFFVMTFPFVLQNLSQNPRNRIMVLLFISYIVFILFTFSKIAILICGIEIAFFALNTIKKQFQVWKNFLLLSVILFLIIGSFFYIMLQENEWLKSKIIKQSFPSRIEYWNQSMKAIHNANIKQIILGYGPASFYDLSVRFQSQPDYWARNPHNFILQLIVENGILTFAAFSLFILITLYRNFRMYSSAEKTALGGVLLYSLGSSLDLLNVYPALLLFFILLLKKSYTSTGLLNTHTIIKVAGLLVCIGVWSLYAFSFGQIMTRQLVEFNNVKIFPFESSFWEVTIANETGDIAQLEQIQALLQKIAPENIELQKMIIIQLARLQKYCDVYRESKKYLSKFPLDSEAQSHFITSIDKCGSATDEDILSFLSSIKNLYDINPANASQIHEFYKSIAKYVVQKGSIDNAFFWLEKSWQSDKWDPSAFEGIDIVKKLKSLPKESAIQYLQQYLLLKQGTNFRNFYQIRLITAKEWKILGEWYSETGKYEDALRSFENSIDIYKYDGEVYGKYARMAHMLSQPDKIEFIYKLCGKTFNNPPWCLELL